MNLNNKFYVITYTTIAIILEILSMYYYFTIDGINTLPQSQLTIAIVCPPTTVVFTAVLINYIKNSHDRNIFYYTTILIISSGQLVKITNYLTMFTFSLPTCITIIVLYNITELVFRLIMIAHCILRINIFYPLSKNVKMVWWSLYSIIGAILIVIMIISQFTQKYGNEYGCVSSDIVFDKLFYSLELAITLTFNIIFAAKFYEFTNKTYEITQSKDNSSSRTIKFTLLLMFTDVLFSLSLILITNDSTLIFGIYYWSVVSDLALNFEILFLLGLNKNWKDLISFTYTKDSTEAIQTSKQ